jgi:predicted amidophosphoribosyltransferase
VPTVSELTELYGNFMLAPRAGPGVCDTCFDLIEETHTRCHRCLRDTGWIDAAVPVSYSVAHEQLHHALRAYKRLPDSLARRFQIELAAVLWRYLETHEACLARAAETASFELVTAVPSGAQKTEDAHPLGRMLGTLIGPTRDRYEPLLTRSGAETKARAFSPEKFSPIQKLQNKSVLLIDDTWTTGASARSAAAALKAAGARTVAVLVIGRHLNRDWAQNDRRLSRLTRPFDWPHCALEPRP